MPVGVIANSLAVFFGGLLGDRLGDTLSERVKESLTMIFGLCAMGMGISTIPFMKNMPAVILSMIVGTLIGTALRLGDRMKAFASGLLHGTCSEELITIIVLFCASSTGIYGALCEGMNGDHSILLTKAILDLFTALIFACSLKKAVAFIAVPQFGIMILLFILARFIGPLCSEAMIFDFKACGGLVLVATGFRLLKTKQFPTADMIPAMILVMPMSWLWSSFVVPLL